jgi:hypothetical protein
VVDLSGITLIFSKLMFLQEIPSDIGVLRLAAKDLVKKSPVKISSRSSFSFIRPTLLLFKLLTNHFYSFEIRNWDLEVVLSFDPFSLEVPTIYFCR